MSSIKNIILKNIKIPNWVKLLIGVILTITITIITVLVYKKKETPESCDLPKCDPCLFGNPTEWGICNKSNEQYRIIPNVGYKKTNTSSEQLFEKCKSKQEKRSCKYVRFYILFHDKCELDSIILQEEMTSEKPEVIIPDNKKNIKKISLPFYSILNQIGKLILESEDNQIVEITETPYCLPDNFILKKVKLISN